MKTTIFTIFMIACGSNGTTTVIDTVKPVDTVKKVDTTVKDTTPIK